MDLKQDLTEEKINSVLAYDGTFMKVLRDTVLLPNKKKVTREYFPHPGAVVIIPLFEDGKVLLERQFRYALHQVFIEFPAGKIDPGESSLICAKRELREETGLEATEWHFLCTIHNAIAYSNEHLDIYLARGFTAGAAQLDEEEFLETFTATSDELMGWVRSGQITDVKTIIGAFWLDKILQGKWLL